MINIVLFEPEIPQNTGNIMRTCVATNSKLHLIKPLGFKIDDKNLKRSGVNYIDKLDWYVYENYNDFLGKNKNGKFYFLTRYGHNPPSKFESVLNRTCGGIFPTSTKIYAKSLSTWPPLLYKANSSADKSILAIWLK